VTNLYVCGSLLIDMTADEKTQRDAGSIHADQIGKVFAAVGQGKRRCLICDGEFTRQTASEHANVLCKPGIHARVDPFIAGAAKANAMTKKRC
jgi:hypothetical protein